MTDGTVVLAGSAAALLVAAALFSITTALRHNNASGRAWAASGVALLLACWVTVGLPADATAGLTTVVGTVAVVGLVLSAGLLWHGIRVFDRQSSGLVVVLAVAAACAALRLTSWVPVEGAEGVAVAVCAVLLVLGARELGRGPMKANLNTRMLRIAMAVAAPAAVVLAVLVATGAVLLRDVLAAAAVLGVLGLQCLSSMRVERHGSWWSGDVTGGMHPELDVLENESFHIDCRDRLERIGLVGGHAGIVVAAVDDLVSVNDALGREVGDDALQTLAAVVRSHVPPWAVVGHLGAGRFAALVPVDSPQRVHEVAAAVESGLMDLRRGAVGPVGFAASFGTSDTYSSVPETAQLIAAADDDRQASLEASGP